MKKFYARVCWNTKGWTAPSGDAALLERETYAATHRFGHEEWLFNFMWTFEGYHYAFLQGVNSGTHSKGETVIDVLLWAIDADRQHVYIGEITKCEILTEAQSSKASRQHERAGWVDMMKQDVGLIGGATSELSPDSLFNIRFRPEDATQYDDHLPIARSTDRISKLKRYTLVAADESEVNSQWKPRTRTGTKSAPTARSFVRRGSSGGIIDPYHPELQRALMQLLKERFGEDSVLAEAGWVDLTVIDGKKTFLVEIKTDRVAKWAIREALGQILEYAYFGPTKNLPERLFIVAPGPANDETTAYIQLLRNKFSLPITYCQFRSGDALPGAFISHQRA